MTADLSKSKEPDLSPAPEGVVESEGDERGRGILPPNRSGLNLHLQERLLSCGNFSALLDDDDRMGRRPSVQSLGMESTSSRDRDNDDGGYFSMRRVCFRISI
jgi:hypothetical protein